MKVVLVLLAVEAGTVKEGSWFLPSRRVLGRAVKTCVKACAIKACTIKACAITACVIKAVLPSRRVGVLEVGQRRIKPRFGYRLCSWPLWPAELSRVCRCLTARSAL